MAHSVATAPELQQPLGLLQETFDIVWSNGELDLLDRQTLLLSDKATCEACCKHIRMLYIQLNRQEAGTGTATDALSRAMDMLYRFPRRATLTKLTIDTRQFAQPSLPDYILPALLFQGRAKTGSVEILKIVVDTGVSIGDMCITTLACPLLRELSINSRSLGRPVAGPIFSPLATCLRLQRLDLSMLRFLENEHVVAAMGSLAQLPALEHLALRSPKYGEGVGLQDLLQALVVLQQLPSLSIFQRSFLDQEDTPLYCWNHDNVGGEGMLDPLCCLAGMAGLRSLQLGHPYAGAAATLRGRGCVRGLCALTQLTQLTLGPFALGGGAGEALIASLPNLRTLHCRGLDVQPPPTRGSSAWTNSELQLRELRVGGVGSWELGLPSPIGWQDFPFALIDFHRDRMQRDEVFKITMPSGRDGKTLCAELASTLEVVQRLQLAAPSDHIGDPCLYLAFDELNSEPSPAAVLDALHVLGSGLNGLNERLNLVAWRLSDAVMERLALVLPQLTYLVLHNCQYVLQSWQGLRALTAMTELVMRWAAPGDVSLLDLAAILTALPLGCSLNLSIELAEALDLDMWIVGEERLAIAEAEGYSLVLSVEFRGCAEDIEDSCVLTKTAIPPVATLELAA